MSIERSLCKSRNLTYEFFFFGVVLGHLNDADDLVVFVITRGHRRPKLHFAALNQTFTIAGHYTALANRLSRKTRSGATCCDVNEFP